MTQTNENNSTETRKRVFVTHAQIIPEDQHSSLTEKEKAYAAGCRDRGVWLELFCPDDACLAEEERFQIPVFCEDPNTAKKIWLNLFCPDGSCEITSPTQLP